MTHQRPLSKEEMIENLDRAYHRSLLEIERQSRQIDLLTKSRDREYGRLGSIARHILRLTHTDVPPPHPRGPEEEHDADDSSSCTAS